MSGKIVLISDLRIRTIFILKNTLNKNSFRMFKEKNEKSFFTSGKIYTFAERISTNTKK